MFFYWFLFTLAAYFAVTHSRAIVPSEHGDNWSKQWWMIFFVLVLIIGMRHEVGADWPHYIIHLERATGVSHTEAIAQNDPAYGFLNWIGGHWGGIYLVNTVCAALFAWGLLAFCRTQPLPWLALTVAIPFLVIAVAMGVTRQGVAIGLAMLALVALGKGRTLHFVLWIAIAALFHKSAIILVPMAVLAGTKRKLWIVIWVGVATALLFVLLLQEYVDNLQSLYLEAEHQSPGAAIRIVMNALPALLFLFFRRRFALPKVQQDFWNGVALSALLFVALLYLSPSSTAVDRVALYWMSLQLFVLSRVPIAFGGRRGNKKIWIILVVAYSAAVQFVWLMFSNTAFAWLPYQFYPWVWLQL
jgi:hypothetical protein